MTFAAASLAESDSSPPASSRRLTPSEESRIAEQIEEAEIEMARLIARSRGALRELGVMGTQLRANPKHARDALRFTAPERRASAASSAKVIEVLSAAGRCSDADVFHANAEALVRDLVSVRLHRRLLDRAAAAAEAASLVATALRRAQLRADQSKAQLVTANLHVAENVARRFRRRGVDVADLVQEGTIGLVRACDKFDHRLGFRFGTYATWWVRQQIARALVEHRAGIRIPLETAGAKHRVARATRSFKTLHGREPTLGELSQASRLPPALVGSVQHLVPETVSLHGESGDTKSLEDVLHDKHVSPPDEALASERMKASLRSLVRTLPPRYREIVGLRFGLAGEESQGLSLQEVGTRLHLSRERVRRLEVRALKKLHELSSRDNLQTYLTG